MEILYIWLTIAFNYNYKNIKLLLENFDCEEEILNLSEKQLNNFNLKENIIKRLTSSELKQHAEKIYNQCQRENIQIISKNSEKYPLNLKNITSQPLILFVKGSLDIKDEYSLAIVGSRNCTDYGRIITTKITSELSEVKIPIVSGMARGIDYYAHKAAIDNKNRTIAFLGCGINVIYPAENKKIYNSIIENGAIISEFMPDTQPQKAYFPLRNRLISGISLGTLVVEAGKKSGSMITASFAAEQGKSVFAIPGNILSPLSDGTNELIKDGAKPVTKTEDILEELYIELSHNINRSTPSINLSGKEKIIFEAIKFEALTIEKISKETHIQLNELNSILTILELQDYIKKLPGNNFIRNEKYL